jgi:tetratricopeptide (TPR) repeat protein
MKKQIYSVLVLFLTFYTCIAQKPKSSQQPKIDYYSQGINQYKENKYAESVNSFNLYLKGNPKDIRGYYNRGLAKVIRDFGNEKGDAIADFQYVLRNSNDIELKKNSLIMIGTALKWSKDYTGAIENYEAALNLTKGTYSFRSLDYDSYVEIADCYFQNSDYEKSIEASSKAIGINQTRIEAYEKRSSARYNLGLKSAAVLDYEKILSIEPNNWYYLNRMGQYYYMDSQEPNSTFKACYYYANARNAFIAEKNKKGYIGTFTYEDIEKFKSVCGYYLPEYFK